MEFDVLCRETSINYINLAGPGKFSAASMMSLTVEASYEQDALLRARVACRIAESLGIVSPL